MANPHKGEIAIEADGDEYVLHFDIDAICTLEALAGKGIAAILIEMQNNETLSVTRLRQMLWAGLRENQPDLTLKEAGDLIPKLGGAIAVRETLGNAVVAAFPKASNARPTKAGNPKGGIGPRYTKRGAVSEQTMNLSGSEPQGS